MDSQSEQSGSMMRFKIRWFVVFLINGILTVRTVLSDTEVNAIQNGCQPDEFINADTSSCSSCELLCTGGQNKRICGTACEDYFKTKAMQEWKDQQNHQSQEYLKTSEDAQQVSDTAYNMAISALIIAAFALVLCLLVIGPLVYLLFCKRNGHSINLAQATSDTNKGLIGPEGDVEGQT